MVKLKHCWPWTLIFSKITSTKNLLWISVYSCKWTLIHIKYHLGWSWGLNLSKSIRCIQTILFSMTPFSSYVSSNNFWRKFNRHWNFHFWFKEQLHCLQIHKSSTQSRYLWKNTVFKLNWNKPYKTYSKIFKVNVMFMLIIHLN